jgi:hypothetical protein
MVGVGAEVETFGNLEGEQEQRKNRLIDKTFYSYFILYVQYNIVKSTGWLRNTDENQCHQSSVFQTSLNFAVLSAVFTPEFSGVTNESTVAIISVCQKQVLA